MIILLERPFLSNGHLSFASDPASQAAGEEKCVNAAIQIWHLVDAYKKAFTLRRTPYFLSYATYSAIVVMLNQPITDSSQYVECIRFFWFALLDFQKGSTSGLRKPLKILQKLMQRLGRSVPPIEPKEAENSNEETLPMHRQSNRLEDGVGFDGGLNGDTQNIWPVDVPGLDALLQQGLEMEGWGNENWMDTMMDDHGLMDDSLFGLFTPGQPMMPGYGQPF